MSKQQITIAVGILSLLAGLAIYMCEWTYPGGPSYCNLGVEGSLCRIYLLPLAVSVILGILGAQNPLLHWSLFMIPSWLVRELSLIAAGGNLWPPIVFLDLTHLIATGIIFVGTALITRKFLSRQAR